VSERVSRLTLGGQLSARLALRVDSICARLESGEIEPIAATDPIAVARRVDALCERFENDWRRGANPAIEDYLPSREDPVWMHALRELVALERELRSDAGESASPAEYRKRFPDGSSLLDDALGGPETRTAPPTRTRTPAPALEPLAGARIGDHELIEEIGRGGMGVVFRARHVLIGRTVALKMILSGDFASESETLRFRAEAEAVANLDHPHIVPIYEVGEHAGRPYYTMRLLPGGSLAQRIRTSRLDARSAARLIATVARAMDHAHCRGFIHRDLKPPNVLFDEAGKPFVTDFGLAKRLGQTGPTGHGAPMGTPGYMAPEQAAGRRDVTASADIYSLGAILYELVAGRPPFRAATVIETLVQVMEGDAVSPRRLNPAVPADLDFICLKCLERDPARRYGSAGALADDLDRYLLGEVVEASRGSLAGAVLRKARQEPELATRLGALAILGTFVQLKFLLGGAHQRWPHLLVTAVLVIWVLTTLLFHFALRRDWRADLVKLAWITSEVLLTSAILRIRDNTMSSGVVVYPLLIVAAGLWSRVRLVWWATVTAVVAYTLLTLESFLRKGLPGQDNNESIVVGVLIVTGFVVAKHVNRVLAISSYYEHGSKTMS
jgi:serine/threonine-protein kinase